MLTTDRASDQVKFSPTALTRSMLCVFTSKKGDCPQSTEIDNRWSLMARLLLFYFHTDRHRLRCNTQTCIFANHFLAPCRNGSIYYMALLSYLCRLKMKKNQPAVILEGRSISYDTKFSRICETFLVNINCRFFISKSNCCTEKMSNKMASPPWQSFKALRSLITLLTPGSKWRHVM